jgi:hypothetical protein
MMKPIHRPKDENKLRALSRKLFEGEKGEMLLLAFVISAGAVACNALDRAYHLFIITFSTWVLSVVAAFCLYKYIFLIWNYWNE